MKYEKTAMYAVCAALALCAALVSATVQAAPSAVAFISDVSGRVKVMASGDEDWQDAKEGMVLSKGMSVRTEARASAKISFDKGHVLIVDPLSVFQVKDLEYDKAGGREKTSLDIKTGKILVGVQKLEAKNNSEFSIKTPTALAAVRGTRFVVDVGEDETTNIVVLEGQLAIIAEGIEMMLDQNFQMMVEPGMAPAAPEAVPEEMKQEYNNQMREAGGAERVEGGSSEAPSAPAPTSTTETVAVETVVIESAADILMQSEIVQEYNTPGYGCCDQ